MKSIVQISMAYALLLSLFGTIEAARKYSPGVAENRAISGDFDVEESEQILEDLSQEWKVLNPDIVSEISNRQRGRGVNTRRREAEASALGERKSRDREYQVPPATPEQLTKNEQNDIRLVENIKNNLKYFIERLYNADAFDRWQLATKERFLGQYSEIHFHIKTDGYNKAYESLINAFNSFTSKVEEFEFTTDDVLKREYLDRAVSECSTLIDELSKLPRNESNQQQYLAIVKLLSEWNKKRLVAQLNLNTDQFVKTLNAYMKDFGGAAEEKSVVDCLRFMSNVLENFMKKRYMTSKGWRVAFYSLSEQFKDGVDTFQIPQEDIEKYPNEIKGLIESYNSFISNIWMYESEGTPDKQLLIAGIAEANRCLLNLRELMSINSNNKKYTLKIAGLLSDWYLFRIQNKLNWSDGLKLDQEQSGKLADFAKLAKSFFDN